MFPDSLLPDSFPIEIHLYGVMVAVGVIAALFLFTACAKKQGVGEKFIDFVFYNGLVAIAVGFFSAALFQGIYDYLDGREFTLKNMTFLGGLIGGVVCFLLGYFLFRKKYDTRLYQVLSIVPCSILVAHGCGRVGCFFAGCCYGKPTDSFLGVQFPHLDHPVHPTQLYEAAFLFLLCGVCFFLWWKRRFRHNMSVYLIAYGVFRFAIEFLRDDERGELVGFVTPSQFWALLMIVLGVGLIFAMRYWYKKAETAAAVAEIPAESTLGLDAEDFED